MSSVKENKEEQIRLEVRRFFSETLMSLYASEGVPEHERTPRRQKEVGMKHYEEISARFFDDMFYRLARINWELT